MVIITIANYQEILFKSNLFEKVFFKISRIFNSVDSNYLSDVNQTIIKEFFLLFSINVNFSVEQIFPRKLNLLFPTERLVEIVRQTKS